MSGLRSVTVYCGSSNDVDQAYLTLADDLGEAIAEAGLRLVYGGGNVGLMGRVALSAHRRGARVLGVMPIFLRDIEGVIEDIENQFVETMHERKRILFDEGDAFIVLPGGIGTLEEAIETLSWAKLSLHRKPMAFLSTNGYWAPFFHLIDHVIEDRFAPASFRHLIAEVRSPKEALQVLEDRRIALD
ncbi:TIGR00730 family Rossman fold protein [bacterium]|nr:TIGR00730 family Rossman fold protein [bacterium]